MTQSVVEHVVVVAVDPEFQAVYERLQNRQWLVDEKERQCREVIGTWGGKTVQLLQSGLGPVTFARNFGASSLKAHRVSLLGICGALREGLGCGDIVGATEVIDEALGARWGRVNSDSLPMTDTAFGAPVMINGSFLCMNRIVETPADKLKLGIQWKCDVVDMESFPYVQRCFELGVHGQVLKVVSDDVTQNLPPVNRARLNNGEYDLKALSQIWKKQSVDASRAARENLYLSLENLLSVFESSYLGQNSGSRWVC